MLKVNCSKCGYSHLSTEVETLNIEEDIQGYDLVTYICPITKDQTKAYVIGTPDEEYYYE